MEPPAKRQRLSPPVEERFLHESSSDDDDFYAPAPRTEQQKPPHEHLNAPEETDYDDEVEILDEGEEVEEINEADLHIRRAQSLNKIRTKWDEICEKYGREFENTDEIDLNTLEVVVDNGHISQMQDETDVGNGQPTPRRESRRTQYEEHDGGSRNMHKRRYDDIQRSLERKIHHDRRSPRRKSCSAQKSDLRRHLGHDIHKAKEIIYEDESSDDEFLYEKPAPSTVVLAPRQPQAMNQIGPRQGSRTVVEKRTVITTKRITTIRDGRSQRSGSRDENHGRHTSHERTSREVQRYTKSSQEKVVETSSDDELVQREPAPLKERVRSPSLDGKDSLWAPKRKVGRPRIHHGERSEIHHRPSPRREKREKRVVRYDENGRKIRKPRNDRGKMRVPEHLRKTRFVNKYEGLDLESENSMLEAPSLASDPQPEWRSTDSSAPEPTLRSKEALKPMPKPTVFARNTVDRSYDFSDEEDDALPQTRPSILTASSTDTFLGQDTCQPQDKMQPKQNDTLYDHFSPKIDGTTTFQTPHSPPPPYTEFEYHPTDLDQYHMDTEDAHFAAPMAQMSAMPQMETLHQFLPLEGESSFMDACLSFPPTSPGQYQDYQRHCDAQAEAKPVDTAPANEAHKCESEDDLSIPIDPALLALDAENRAASLERAQAAVDEPGMEGTVVPTLPFEENFGDGIEEDDSDDDLFASETKPPSLLHDAVGAHESDDGDDLEDFLMPVQQPAALCHASQVTAEEEPNLEDATMSSAAETKVSPIAETTSEETDELKGITTRDFQALEQLTLTVPETCDVEFPSSPLSDVPESFDDEDAINIKDDTNSLVKTSFCFEKITSVDAAASDSIPRSTTAEPEDAQSASSMEGETLPEADPEQSFEARSKSPPIVSITSELGWQDETAQMTPSTEKDQFLSDDTVKAAPPVQNIKCFAKTEVPDSEADSEDELLTQPSSQPLSRASIFSSQASPAQPTPRTMSAMKRVRFADSVIEEQVARLKELPPPRWSPLTDQEEVKPQRSSSPDWQPQALGDEKDVPEEDDEDDIALLPNSPVRRPRSMPKPASVAPAASAKPTPSPKPPACAEEPESRPSTAANSKPHHKDEDELSSPKSILKRPSRSTTPQPPAKPSSRSTQPSRATPPRLFSLSVSPQSSTQPKPRPKLRASLLSESASTTSRRTTPTPPPSTTQSVSTSHRRPSPRLLSASPLPTTAPAGMKRSRSEVQALVRRQASRTNGDKDHEEEEVVEPSFRRSASEESRGRSASAEMPESDRQCGQRGFRCERTICFKCKG